MKFVAVVALVAGCGRIGFDAATMIAGDAGGSSCPSAPAATLTIQAGDDFYGTLATLAAGTVVEVGAGTYPSPGNAPLTWNGTAAAPIIVRAAPGTRPVLTNTPGNNGLDLYGSYFTLTGFELTGGDEGVRLGGVDHVTLDSLFIHDVVDQGVTCNRPGMSCSNLTFARIEVGHTGNANTGTGITIGCSDDSCGTTNAVVENCYVHDTQGSAGAGLAVWKHSGLEARDNVFVTTNGPGIVVQESASSGRDTLERNFVWNPSNNGIQVEGQLIVRNNLVIGSTQDGIVSRQQSGPAPINVDIVHNTITADTCIHSLGWSGTSYVVANNAMQCATTDLMLTGSPVTAANLDFTAADVIGMPNAYPTAGSALVDAGDATHSASDDFNATPRTGSPDVGAYERTTATNPGWQPTGAQKPFTSECP